MADYTASVLFDARAKQLEKWAASAADELASEGVKS